MSFEPIFCPYSSCEQHGSPVAGFFVRHGYYQPSCRSEPVPRFRCRSCRRTFSRQTFRQDYGDRRPECNGRLFELLTSGVGYRQSARLLRMAAGAVQRKARKLARHAAHLHRNLSPRLPDGATFLLDEEETYEHASIRTLTMPVLIEKENWFVVATAVGPTRRLAKAGSARRRWQDREERQRGKRLDSSRQCVETVLKELAKRLGAHQFVLRSDEKSSYGVIAREVFGDRLVHQTTSGRLPRTAHNPLFPINTTLAMTRDNCGRLRRQSWLVTKKQAFLQSHMALFVVYRNYIRRRFNRDKENKSPATRLQLIPRNLTVDDAIRWRQHWGGRSLHPLSQDGTRSIDPLVAQPA